jgi:serine/threonine-protein kinase
LNDWKTFDQAAYTIQYPSTWELNQSEQMGTSFILFSPLESEKDQFKENVNLLIQDLAGYHVDLNEYTEITEGQIKTMVTNAILSESVRVKNDKGEYHKLIYSGDQGIFHLTYEQYYWVMNDKAFILTFTCEQNKFVQMADTGEKILNSFKLKK